jgi:hypothetical protein
LPWEATRDDHVRSRWRSGSLGRGGRWLRFGAARRASTFTGSGSSDRPSARWSASRFTTTALHAPLEDWFAWILDAGSRLRAFREPVPTADAIAQQPKLADAKRVPYFAMFDLARDG